MTAPLATGKMKFREVVRRWDWLLVVAIAPFMLFPEARQGWVLLVIPGVLAVQWWAWRDILPVTPLNPAILLLRVMVGVSMMVTPDQAGSMGKIVGVLYGMVVYFCVVRHTRTQHEWKVSLVLFTLAGMGVSLAGLVGMKSITNKIIGLDELSARLPILIRGLPGAEEGIHPNELAGSLMWALPVIAVAGLALAREAEWFSSRDERGKLRLVQILGWAAFIILAILLEAGALVLTQSRGGYLAIVLTGLALMVLIPRWPARWLAIGLLVIDGIIGLVLVYQLGWEPIMNQVVGSLPSGESAFSVVSMSQRLEIWSRAIWAIRDVPLTGLGMNVFRSAMNILYPTFQVLGGYDIGHAHNEFLQAALDLGLPGLVGFLALYAGALGMLVPAIRSDRAWRILGLGLLGGLMAHFIFGITDAIALGAKPGFLFWWLLGMVVGLYSQKRTVKTS